MPEDRTKQLHGRLTTIQARLKALAEAEDQASWGGSGASRGGFRQERINLSDEADRIQDELNGGSSGA